MSLLAVMRVREEPTELFRIVTAKDGLAGLESLGDQLSEADLRADLSARGFAAPAIDELIAVARSSTPSQG